MANLFGKVFRRKKRNNLEDTLWGWTGAKFRPPQPQPQPPQGPTPAEVAEQNRLEAERVAREQQEAAAKRQRDAEAAARRQREAEEAARRQREADEVARRQREAEEAARRQREAEEAEAQRRREAEEAACRQREAEEAARQAAIDADINTTVAMSESLPNDNLLRGYANGFVQNRHNNDSDDLLIAGHNDERFMANAEQPPEELKIISNEEDVNNQTTQANADHAMKEETEMPQPNEIEQNAKIILPAVLTTLAAAPVIYYAGKAIYERYKDKNAIENEREALRQQRVTLQSMTTEIQAAEEYHMTHFITEDNIRGEDVDAFVARLHDIEERLEKNFPEQQPLKLRLAIMLSDLEKDFTENFEEIDVNEARPSLNGPGI